MQADEARLRSKTEELRNAEQAIEGMRSRLEADAMAAQRAAAVVDSERNQIKVATLFGNTLYTLIGLHMESCLTKQWLCQQAQSLPATHKNAQIIYATNLIFGGIRNLQRLQDKRVCMLPGAH